MTDEDQPNPYAAPVSLADGLVDPEQYFDGRLRITGWGLRLIYAGILLMLFCWILVIPVTMLRIGVMVGSILVSLGMLLGLGLINLGPLLCLTVPRESGLRWYIVPAVLAQIPAAVFVVLQSTFDGPPGTMSIVTLACALIGAALFLLFLFRLAKTIERADLAKRCRNVSLLGSAVLFVITPGAFLILGSVGATGVELVAGVTMGGSYLLLFVAYANVVNALAGAILRPHVKKAPAGIA